jgi:hypothetical protein
VADSIDSLIEKALTRAAAMPGGTALFSSKTTQGLFPATVLGKTAAKKVCDHGWLESKGNVAKVTQQGLDQLMVISNPKLILDDFVRVLEARETQISELIHTTQEMKSQLISLRRVIETVLPKVAVARTDHSQQTDHRYFNSDRHGMVEYSVATALNTDIQSAILEQLRTRLAVANEDCPLPELFRDLPCPTTLGLFHDSLRKLHGEGLIYLHPWTGPLYELPEPALSLLVGHEIVYYASVKE